MKKWEYSMPYYARGIDEGILDYMGNEGWELIVVLDAIDDNTKRWIFKREKTEAISAVDGD